MVLQKKNSSGGIGWGGDALTFAGQCDISLILYRSCHVRKNVQASEMHRNALNNHPCDLLGKIDFYNSRRIGRSSDLQKANSKCWIGLPEVIG
jgi:hypothetical protein